MTTTKYGRVTEAVMAQATVAGAAGVSSAEMTGYTVDVAGAAICRLVADGRLFKASTGHRSKRYFVRLDWAIAYQDEHSAQGPSVLRNAPSRAQWSAPQKGVIEPVEGITPNTIITIYQPRHIDAIRTQTHEESSL